MTLDAYMTGAVVLATLLAFVFLAGVAWELLQGWGDGVERGIGAVLWPVALTAYCMWFVTSRVVHAGRWLAARAKGARLSPARVVRR